jgi:sigma-B regulation protein RsbU (phosphoserine phosphatase)
MNTTPRVLLFGSAPAVSDELGERLRQRGLTPLHLDWDDPGPAGASGGNDAAVVLLDPTRPVQETEPLQALLKRLTAENVATLVWGAGQELPREGGPLVEWLAPEVGLDELVGKIGTLTRYVPLLKGLERELHNLQRLGRQLNHYFAEIDQEMRLAGRLQRDFLPHQLPSTPPFRFEAIFRPASWVSGDLYDAFRIDADHLGVFIADAMGHGVAAGLLTMFLRQALPTKRIAGSSYEVVGPAEALAHLHESLVRQKLPNCQFVTAAYGVINLPRRELTLARAGHPHPLHIPRGGEIAELRSEGSLLGLPDVEPDFSERRTTLSSGDKIVFYTDGGEDVLLLPHAADTDQVEFTPQLRCWASLGAAGFVRAVGEYLDCKEGSLHPADDVTVLVLEVADGV